jgi:hypothetical protein
MDSSKLGIRFGSSLLYALEKIVKMTPTKYDDILFDMLLKPIKEKFAPSKK